METETVFDLYEYLNDPATGFHAASRVSNAAYKIELAVRDLCADLTPGQVRAAVADTVESVLGV